MLVCMHISMCTYVCSSICGRRQYRAVPRRSHRRRSHCTAYRLASDHALQSRPKCTASVESLVFRKSVYPRNLVHRQALPHLFRGGSLCSNQILTTREKTGRRIATHKEPNPTEFFFRLVFSRHEFCSPSARTRARAG